MLQRRVEALLVEHERLRTENDKLTKRCAELTRKNKDLADKVGWAWLGGGAGVGWILYVLASSLPSLPLLCLLLSAGLAAQACLSVQGTNRP